MSSSEAHLKTGGEEQFIRSKDALLRVPESVISCFKDLKVRRKYRYVIFRIQGEELEMEGQNGPPENTYQDLISCLPESECRFVIYDHDIKTDDGRRTSKLFFISWLPHNSSPSMKMTYTHGKGILRHSFEGCYDVNASTHEEVLRGIGVQQDTGSDSGSDFSDN